MCGIEGVWYRDLPGGVLADTPSPADIPSPEMATAAVSTHPTGMHSCFEYTITAINDIKVIGS